MRPVTHTAEVAVKSADSKEVTVPLLHETGSIRMIVPTRITTIKPRIITWNLESLFFLIMLFSIILFCRYDRPVSGSGPSLISLIYKRQLPDGLYSSRQNTLQVMLFFQSVCISMFAVKQYNCRIGKCSRSPLLFF